jgi:hypothetical protein
MPIENNQILQAQGGFEPQRKNNWILQINSSAVTGFTSNDFYLALKSFPFPKEENPTKRIRWFNESRTYAGSLGDFSDISLQLHDYLDANTAMIIYNWRRLVWDPANSTVGLAANYKMNGMLYLAPPNAASIPDIIGSSRTWYLQGIWPTYVDFGELDLTSEADEVLITCQLAIDRAYPGDPDGTPNVQNAGPQAINTGAI